MARLLALTMSVAMISSCSGIVEPAPPFLSAATDAAGEGDSDSGVGTLGCGERVVVTGPQGILSAVEKAGWVRHEWYSPRLPVVDDLDIQASFVMNEADFPAGWDPLDWCSRIPRFVVDPHVQGVTVVGEISENTGRTVSFSPTVVRLRAVYYWSLYPCPFAEIRIIPGCSSPCLEGFAKCDYNADCYEKGERFCLDCEAQDRKTCACRTASGTQSEGSACDYQVADDLECEGTCSAGFCKPFPEHGCK